MNDYERMELFRLRQKSAALQDETARLRTTLTDALNWYERQAQSAGDFEMVERVKKALGV